MRGRKLSIFALVAIMSGCYHVTVLTGLPESTTTIDKAFQMSFAAGLVPPAEIDAEAEGCTEGVAKVHVWHSFVNILVRVITSSILSPISVSVTCAD